MLRMRAVGRKYAPLLAMLVFPILGWIYAAVNKVDGKVYSLFTSVDRDIPFVKFFALPYAVWIVYIYICIVYFFKKDVKVFYRAVATYTVCALTCYLIYSVFQTTVPRPALVGDDVFTQLVAYIYNRDQPFNCFPSIHCFSSYMVIRLLASSGFKNKWNLTLIGTMSTLIMLSTLFIKQHAILDLFAGVALVELALPAIAYMERLVFGGSRVQERTRGTYGA